MIMQTSRSVPLLAGILMLASGGTTPSATVPEARPGRPTSSVSAMSASTAPARKTEAPSMRPAADIDALVRELGKPVAFDRVFSDVRAIPRFKDEFETTARFETRQAAALAKCQRRYLIDVPVDPESVRYDADKQVLVVATYALTNTVASSHELDAVFGYGSELSRAGVKVGYTTLSSGNVVWTLPREQRNVGVYDGSNAFGATVTIMKQEGIARGVFEREGKYEESVWTKVRAPYVKDSRPVAFEIKADPQRAKAIKQGGLQAAIIIQGAAIYDGSGELLATRETR